MAFVPLCCAFTYRLDMPYKYQFFMNQRKLNNKRIDHEKYVTEFKEIHTQTLTIKNELSNEIRVSEVRAYSAQLMTGKKI